MTIFPYVRTLLILPVFCVISAAQQPAPPPSSQPSASASGPLPQIHLDVVVRGEKGALVGNIQQSDFILLDNNVARPITSFRALGKEAPVSVIFVIDAVNISPITMGYERDQLKKFLLANDGQLDRPTALAIVTDDGVSMQEGFTRDGRGLVQSLDPIVTGVRSIRRSAGFYGAEERLDLGVNAVRSLTARVAGQPGRKLMVWISPGWPLLTGPRLDLTSHDQQSIFSGIVQLSTQLREAGVTLYSVDPLGAGEDVGRRFFFEGYLKGVSAPKHTDLADLSLQVLAVQSGGRVLNGSNDIAAYLKDCVDDTDTFYELSFVPSPGESQNEYHQIDVRVAQTRLTVQARRSYYAQPTLLATK